MPKHYDNANHLDFKDAELIRDIWERHACKNSFACKDDVKVILDTWEITRPVMLRIVRFKTLAQPPGYQALMTEGGRGKPGCRHRRNPKEGGLPEYPTPGSMVGYEV